MQILSTNKLIDHDHLHEFVGQAKAFERERIYNALIEKAKGWDSLIVVDFIEEFIKEQGHE